MSVLAWIGTVVVVVICGVVSFFCLGALLRREDRLDSLRQLEAWRLVPFGVLLLLACGCAIWPRQSQLRCERDGAQITCSLEQRQLRRSFLRTLPPGALRGSEVEVTTGTDDEGYPERQTRLWIVSTEGRFLLTDYGHANADRLHAELERFLGDPSQRTVLLGQENRWYFYPQVPMWLLLAIFSLVGRL